MKITFTTDVTDLYASSEGTTPAEQVALDEAIWFWTERAEDLAEEQRTTVPDLVRWHCEDTAGFLRDIANDDYDLVEHDDDDPSLVSAKLIATQNPVEWWPAIATALDRVAAGLDPDGQPAG